MHAKFEETEENPLNWSCGDTEKCYGGFARVKQAANQLTLDADSRNIPTIFLNAGDMFQGTPYYTLEKWKIVAPLVNAIGFDVTVIIRFVFFLQSLYLENLFSYL